MHASEIYNNNNNILISAIFLTLHSLSLMTCWVSPKVLTCSQRFIIAIIASLQLLPLEVQQGYICSYTHSLLKGMCSNAHLNCQNAPRHKITLTIPNLLALQSVSCNAVRSYLAPETVSSEALHSFVRLCLHRYSVAALCCGEEQRLLLLAFLLLASSVLCLLLLWSWAGMLRPACCILPLPLLQARCPYCCVSQTQIIGASAVKHMSSHGQPLGER